MYINEIFYSIEGEGRRIGQPTIFVRMQGCPWRCPYCDTPAAQEFFLGLEMAPEDVATKISDIRARTGCSVMRICVQADF